MRAFIPVIEVCLGFIAVWWIALTYKDWPDYFYQGWGYIIGLFS